jgi:hypothetical protein
LTPQYKYKAPIFTFKYSTNVSGDNDSIFRIVKHEIINLLTPMTTKEKGAGCKSYNVSIVIGLPAFKRQAYFVSQHNQPLIFKDKTSAHSS